MMSDPETVSGVAFDTDEETELILQNLDEFIEQEVKPIADDISEALVNPRIGHHPDGRFTDELLEAKMEVRKRSAEAGYYAMNLPDEEGNDGVSPVTWYRANKRVTKSEVPLSEEVLANVTGPKPLLQRAEGEQVEKYLRPTKRVEKSTAFALTEPGGGSDSPNLSTTAEKDGDQWVLNGHKQWISNAPYADFIQVFARTTPQEEAGRYGGITCFIVEDDEFEVGAINNVPGLIGRQGEIILDDVRVPESRVLGEVDDAFYASMEFLGLGRVEIGAKCVGRSEFLLEKATQYANEREAFGDNIGSFQSISNKIARGRAKVGVADSFGLYCAWLVAQGESAIAESSILKWFATNAFWEIADDTVQIHGANGLSEENPFMDKLLRARVQRIVEGTDEIQLNTIAKQMGLDTS
jgi:acyl-CoA dehydrogenase